MPILAENIERFLTPSKTFIETGTLWGDGIQAALDAGAERVWSIDSDLQAIKKAQERFAGMPNVRLICDNSVAGLERLFRDSEARAQMGAPTIWLDAHGSHDSPVLEELTVIRNADLPTPNILIDDMRLMPWWGVEISTLMDSVRSVYNLYHIDYVDGCGQRPRDPGMYPKDIMVAYVERS